MIKEKNRRIRLIGVERWWGKIVSKEENLFLAVRQMILLDANFKNFFSQKSQKNLIEQPEF